MNKLFALLVLALSTQSFALSADPTLSEIFSHGYKVKVTVEREFGINVAKVSDYQTVCEGKFTIWMMNWAYQDRLLKHDRTFSIVSEKPLNDYAVSDLNGAIKEVNLLYFLDNPKLSTISSECKGDLTFEVVPNDELQETSAPSSNDSSSTAINPALDAG